MTAHGDIDVSGLAQVMAYCMKHETINRATVDLLCDIDLRRSTRHINSQNKFKICLRGQCIKMLRVRD